MLNSSIIFLHISKTGGTTLRSIIQKQYLADKIYDFDPSYFTGDSTKYESVLKQRFAKFKAMPDAEKAAFECFFHPFSFGLHEILPQPAHYLTMLRDPVDHYISSYYFAVNKPGHIHHNYVKEHQVTLKNYHEHFTVDNFQTRRVSGCDPLDSMYNLMDLPENALERAKDNLRGMAVIGLMEEFDLSLLMMQNKFGWKDVRYQSKNIAPSRKKLSDLDSGTRQIIEDLLADDIALYAFAKDLFEQQKQALDVDPEQALARFQQANQDYKRWIKIKKGVRKALPSFITKALKK